MEHNYYSVLLNESERGQAGGRWDQQGERGRAAETLQPRVVCSIHFRTLEGARWEEQKRGPERESKWQPSERASKGARVDNKWSKIKIKLVHLNKLINSGGRERKDQLHKMHKQQNTTTTRRVFVS